MLALGKKVVFLQRVLKIKQSKQSNNKQLNKTLNNTFIN